MMTTDVLPVGPPLPSLHNLLGNDRERFFLAPRLGPPILHLDGKL
jgi:hypothetical protein